MKMWYRYKKVWNYIDFTMDNLGMKFEEYESRNKTTSLELDINRTDKYGIDVYVGDIIDCDRYDTHEIYTVIINDIKNIPAAMYGSGLNSINIIGNRHDDPELMKLFEFE